MKRNNIYVTECHRAFVRSWVRIKAKKSSILLFTVVPIWSNAQVTGPLTQETTVFRQFHVITSNNDSLIYIMHDFTKTAIFISFLPSSVCVPQMKKRKHQQFY
jgi:hypothetical protein